MHQDVEVPRMRAFSQRNWRAHHDPQGQGTLCSALIYFWLAEKLRSRAPLSQLERGSPELLSRLSRLQALSYYPAFPENFIPGERELSLLNRKYGTYSWKTLQQRVVDQYQGDYVLYDLSQMFRYDAASIVRYADLPPSLPELRSAQAGTAVIGLLRYLDKGRPSGHRIAYYRDREDRHHFFDPNAGEVIEADEDGFHAWLDAFLEHVSYRKFEPSAADAFLTLYRLQNVSQHDEVPNRDRTVTEPKAIADHPANRAWEAARPQFGPGIEPRLPRRQSSSHAQRSLTGVWSECLHPYRHFHATRVFDPETYKALCDEFSLILDTTAGTREGRYKMRPAPGNSDGLILGLTDKLAAAFHPLFSEAWLRSLAALLNLTFLPRVEGALHSNPQGSRTGWIHTDCCSAWFDERNGTPERLMLPPRGRCNYFTGKPKVPDAKPTEYIRAATMIFYLCNDAWEQGDGGETGIYRADYEAEDTLVKLIPPLNNSLFLFECSPRSYHRFVTNPGRTRNSIILWLHANVEDAQARWGQAIHRRDGR